MDKSMKIAIILSAVDKASRVVNTTVGKIQKGLNKFGNGATVAGALGTAFFMGAVNAAEESEVATKRLSTVFESMGQDYKTATAQAEAYANVLQNQIAVEDETIMAVQAKLATFEKAADATARSNDVFNRATLSAFNMQAVGFGDAENNIVQLGKALQDPITGINALRRSGITFTEAEKKKIAILVKGNKVSEAQNMILKAVEKQTGNAAANTVTDTQRMKIAWGEIQEQIGNKLLPAFTELGNYILNTIIPAVTGFVDEHPGLVKWIGIASVALLGMGVIAKIVAFILPVLTGAIKFLRIALLLVGKTLAFVGRLLLGNPIILIAAAIAAIVMVVIKNWKGILGFFKRLWEGIKRVFKIALKIILAIVLAPYHAIRWLWDQLSTFFSNLWTGIGNVARSIWNGVSNFFSSLWQGIKDIATAVWNAIGDAIMAPIQFIKKAWSDFKSWFANLFKGPGKMMNDMIEKAKQAQDIAITAQSSARATMQSFRMAPLGAGFSGVGSRSPSPMPAPVPISSGSTTVSMNNTYNVNGGNPAEIKNMFHQRDRDLLKKVEEAQRKRDRTKF